MITLKRSILTLSLASALFAVPSFVGNTAMAGEQAEAKKTVRVPAMRNRVYGHLALAQKTGDEQGFAAGLAKLDEVKGRIDQLNSYEQAMLWNFYGFMYYSNDDVAGALASFEKVIAIEAIPASLRQSTLRSIGQLSMAQENYQKALDYLTLWRDFTGKELSAGDHVLFAQNYYQLKQYAKAVESIEQAITLYEAKDKLVKENWLVLLRASYYSLEKPQKVTQVMEKLVRLYNKPEHWVQLAGMYGETEQEDKQLATMEAAWQAGYITKGSDMNTLAQLYLYHGVPFKSAKVMEQAMSEGKLPRAEKHLQLVAQSYLMAKNDDKAITPLSEAAKVAEHGNFDAQLAEIYINSEQWHKAIESANMALNKGRLNNPGNIHIVLGMANYNLNRFEKSLYALARAKSFGPTQSMASQWISYVSKEQMTSVKRARL